MIEIFEFANQNLWSRDAELMDSGVQSERYVEHLCHIYEDLIRNKLDYIDMYWVYITKLTIFHLKS